MSSSIFGNVDEYGFKRSEEFDSQNYSLFMSSYLAVLSNRSKKWQKLMKNENNLKESSKIRRYIQKGIPSFYRTLVWSKFAQINEMKLQMGRDLYHKNLNTILDHDIVQSIRTDLPRTFPENIYFEQSDGCQGQLDRILFAFAAGNREVGYCQGLNYIAGLLLLVTKDEETTFWLLKSVIEGILPSYYTKNMKGLKIDMEVLSMIVSTKMPDLHQHIKFLNIPWSLLVMKWFVCLYAEVLPIETVLRIWDCLFYQRSEILFRVGYTIITHNRKALLACDDFTTFMTLFKKMTTDFFVLDCHNFMKKVNKEGKFITNKSLTNLRKIAKIEP